MATIDPHSEEVSPTQTATADQSTGRDTSTTLDADEQPAATCDHCGRPFPTEHLHALHLGDRHGDDLNPHEQAAYEAAQDEETDELFLFHLKVIAALGGLYAILVLVYMVVLAL
ncbi:DUF7410 domain-containing protein [Haloarchaeobius sp. DFWS5]|uniref:DUF7410 domain-containing protein n=1 Tax=Haloarchaeobius sp. DFWS5 TaxID=3446114 RepID=UPI003EB7ACD6